MMITHEQYDDWLKLQYELRQLEDEVARLRKAHAAAQEYIETLERKVERYERDEFRSLAQQW